MSETLCPCCGGGSPDEALYCMRCGEPIKCKNCGAGILANARACIQCGTPISERESGDHQFSGGSLVPPGYNRLRVHEKADVYSYDAEFVFSDIFGQQTGTGEVVARLGGIGDRASPSRPIPQRPSTMPSVVEVDGQQSPLPQLMAGPNSATPPSSRASTGRHDAVHPEERAIHAVFAEHDGTLALQLLDLKAMSQTDYTLRLVHMFLYARKALFGEPSTVRSEVYEVTEFANLPRDNVAVYLSRDGATTKSANGESLSLNLSGLEHARKCLLEIVDPATPAGKWLPSADTHVAHKSRKAAKRGDTEVDDAQVAAFVAHPETRALVNDIPHGRMADLSVLDKVIVALYGLNKTGMEHEVYYGLIEQYLYDAFHVKVTAESIRSSLRTAISHHNKNVLHKDREGYRITPSGIRHVETSLRGKDTHAPHEQPELMESENE